MTTDTLSKLSESQEKINNFVNENQDAIYEIVNNQYISQQDKSFKLLELIPGIEDACYSSYNDDSHGIVVYTNVGTDPLLILLKKK